MPRNTRLCIVVIPRTLSVCSVCIYTSKPMALCIRKTPRQSCTALTSRGLLGSVFSAMEQIQRVVK